jgi:hypothetical protein
MVSVVPVLHPHGTVDSASASMAVSMGGHGPQHVYSGNDSIISAPNDCPVYKDSEQDVLIPIVCTRSVV